MDLAKTLLVTLALAFPAKAGESPFKNLGEIARSVGFDGEVRAAVSRKVKIAILDNGFKGHADEIGKSLPASTVFHAGPVAVASENEESHGFFMAQLVSGLLDTAGVSYDLHLYSAFGYSNLDAAVKAVVNEKFDVVLYSQVWEYGGNGDGAGFINRLVSQATSSGITWVNAAGNFGSGTYQAPIQAAEDNWVKLPGANNGVRVRCLESSRKKCGLRIVMSWNDFKDDVSEGTDKDLDLVLTDDSLKILRSSSLAQKKSFPENEPGSSLYPREIIQYEVDPGLYFIRAKMRSQNFDPSRDRLRMTVSGDFVQLLDTTPSETVLTPADNAGVITVGATDSEKSGASRSRGKPELVAPSKVVLQNGETYKGSSNSAAIAAAAVALMKAVKPDLSRERILELLARETTADSQYDLNTFGFEPTGPGCFYLSRLPQVPPAAQWYLGNGGVVVETTRGLKILTPFDPLASVTGLEKKRPEEILAAGQSLEILPRSRQGALPGGAVEVLQFPRGQAVCDRNGNRPPSLPRVKAALRLPRASEIR